MRVIYVPLCDTQGIVDACLGVGYIATSTSPIRLMHLQASTSTCGWASEACHGF